MISYKTNQVSCTEIKEHLLACEFVPNIDYYVENIDEYIKKIMLYAVLIECWENERLVGFIAFYCNNISNGEAFITNISVIPEFNGRGIATKLLTKAYAYSKNKGFTTISLEVFNINVGAKALYKKAGFVVTEINENKLKMTLRLDKDQ